MITKKKKSAPKQHRSFYTRELQANMFFNEEKNYENDETACKPYLYKVYILVFCVRKFI
jgi:hypothetical protein